MPCHVGLYQDKFFADIALNFTDIEINMKQIKRDFQW